MARKKKQTLVLETGLKIVKTPKVLIPLKIFEVMVALDRQIDREAGIVCRGDWDENGNFVLSEEFYVPEQETTTATIEFKEPVLRTDWNVVIHKHPHGVTSFSSTDDEHINKNFDASILFCDGRFTDAVVNIKIKPGVYVQVAAEPEIVVDELIPDEMVQKIREKKYVSRKISPTKNSKRTVRVFDDEDDFIRGLSPEEMYMLGYWDEELWEQYKRYDTGGW